MIVGIKAQKRPFTALLDENVPVSIQPWIEAQRPSWQVFHVLHVGLGGKTDLEVLAWSQENQAVIITFDGDFINNPKITGQNHFGIIRMRIHPTTIEETQCALKRLLSEFSDDAISGALISIGRDKIRVRPGRMPS